MGRLVAEGNGGKGILRGEGLFPLTGNEFVAARRLVGLLGAGLAGLGVSTSPSRERIPSGHSLGPNSFDAHFVHCHSGSLASEGAPESESQDRSR